MNACLPFLVICCLSLVTNVQADNWAHWRGPTGNGVAVNATPPTEWSDTKNVKWKVRIPGRGSGSPIIWKDQVFVVTAVPAANASADATTTDGSRNASQDNRGGRRRRGAGNGNQPKLQFKLLCFKRSNGELSWERTVVEATPHQGTHATNGFASASPCTDGEHVYAHFGSRGLYCYTTDGNLKWKRDLGQMSTRNSFGEGSSPTLEGDRILVPWDHEGQSALYCLNKATGETIWKATRDEPTCWATPLIVEHNGKKQVVMNGQNSARAYDLESGEEIWRCDGQTERPAASPVADRGLVFVGSGFRGSYLGAFRLGGHGDIEGTENVAWTIDRDTPDIASPLLSGGRLYFYKGKSGILSCVDAA
ncbi:MAG: PQQ-binding-like beta-propeller repeat protein, partial [Planctomycetaceae bacterium]|nr:PQQ-binding-like beta-propeller repeat protein [Planctomycetaceae bacterium]